MKAPEEFTTNVEQVILDAIRECADGASKAIAHASHTPLSNVYEMQAGERKNPALTLYQWLAASNNDAPLLALARLRGYVVVKVNMEATDDQDFSSVLQKVAGFVEAKASTEADGIVTVAERRERAHAALELSERATAYARRELALAEAEHAQMRMTVRRFA